MCPFSASCPLYAEKKKGKELSLVCGEEEGKRVVPCMRRRLILLSFVCGSLFLSTEGKRDPHTRDN